jgi:hypothetical protein
MTEAVNQVQNFKTDPVEQRGASSLTELAAILFLAFQKEEKFDALLNFIPDSSVMREMYALSSTSYQQQEADSALNGAIEKLKEEYALTSLRVKQSGLDWKNATALELNVYNMGIAEIPSRKIFLVCESNKLKFGVSVQCLQINGRWFLGENLHYGI